MAGLICIGLSTPAVAEDSAAAPTVESSSQVRDSAHDADEIEVEIEIVRFNLALTRASIREQVVTAMEETDRSFVLSRDLEGWSSILLHEVTLEEALDLMLLPHDARWIEEDGIIHVMSQAEWTDRYGDEHGVPGEVPSEADASETDSATATDEADQDEADDAGTFDVKVTDLDITQILQLLFIQSHRNIVVSNDVSGIVTCSLTEVTFDNALDAILAIHDLKRVDLDNAIWITTQEEWDARQAQANEDVASADDEPATQE